MSLLTMPTKKNPRDKEDSIVHALAKWVLGKHTAKNIFGNIDYNKTFIEGTVINVFDRHKPNGKNAVWVVRVDFMLPSDDPMAVAKLKRAEIHRQHCIPGPVLTGKNPPCRTTFMDSVGDPNHAVKGSTTYLPNAKGRRADAAAAKEAAATLPPDPLVSATADDNKIDTAPAPPPMEHAHAAKKAKNRRKKATPSAATHDHASTATPPPSTTPAAKKSKAPKKKKATKPVDLHTTPMWSVMTNGASHCVVAIAHEQKWVVSSDTTFTGNVANEPLSSRQWHQKGPSDERIASGYPDFKDMLPFDAFFHMMPPEQITLVLELSNKRLAAKGKKELTRQELLWWIGVCILILSINFRGNRRKLWEGGGAYSEFLPSYNLRAAGLSRNCFKDIRYVIRWSQQPPKQPAGMSSEQYLWMLIDNFVANINRHRASMFVPGNEVEADETAICWYGVGGAYVNKGLPMYLALECKPSNGGEIQNLADIALGIMLHLKIVKSANKEKAIASAAANAIVADNNIAAANKGGNGTQVLLELTEPWHHYGRLVTASAYFASVKAALKIKEKGLDFIGSVKQCSRRFPMEVLRNVPLSKQGSQMVLASISEETGKTELVAMSWLD